MRLLLWLALLAPIAAAQTTPPPAPPAWEGQFASSTVKVTLYPRGAAVAGAIDIGGALHPLEGQLGEDGLISGVFRAGAKEFEFEAALEEEGAVLRLASDGTTLRLPRRKESPGTKERRNPLAEPARPTAGACDLSHVKVGQRYTYAMQNDMQQEWIVKEVGPDFVRYDMRMLMGGNLLGDPMEQEWRYVAPVAAPQVQATPANVKVSRETVVVGGIEFDCLVTEASGYKSWLSMTPGSDTVWTFPGVIKTVQLSDGSAIMVLSSVRD